MRKTSLTLCILLLISGLALAQDTLVKVNGETLEGRVNFATNSLNKEYVTVKIGRKKTKLNVLEVRQIKMGNGDLVKPVSFNGAFKFGKELISGYLSHYRVTRDNNPEKFNADLLYKMDGTYVLLGGKMGFRSVTRNFLGDCSQLADGIQNKKYHRNDISSLVNDYNTCVSRRGLVNSTSIEEKAKQDRIAKEQEKALELPKDLQQKLSDFATLLEYSDRVSNKADVTAMFNDVSEKLRKKEAIPNYLKTALTEAVKTDPQLQKLISEILK